MSPTPSSSSLKILTLCTLALDTVLPSISIGSNIATGLISPVLLQLHSISMSLVSAISSCHLNAMLCLGNFPVLPSDSPYFMSLKVRTNPSDGISISSTLFLKYSIAFSMFLASTVADSTQSNPYSLRMFMASTTVENSLPSHFTKLKA